MVRNDVALSADFKDVLVVETNLNGVHRAFMTTGRTEVFVDKIPTCRTGYPGADGGFWIGVVRLSPLPRLRALQARTPWRTSSGLCYHAAKPAGLVFKVDSTGKPADALAICQVRACRP